MEIYRSPRIVVRTWEWEDAESLARHADNPRIAGNLRDFFPHPYFISDARKFIDHCRSLEPPTEFAVALTDGEAIGAVGLTLGRDVERFSAEVGYWLSESFWGKGIAVEALRAVSGYAVEELRLIRLFAKVYSWNQASCRVLEKCGYVIEGRLRKAAVKNGKITDMLLYALVKEGVEALI